MIMDEFDIATLTDEVLEGAPTSDLRQWVTLAGTRIYRHDRERTIFSVEIDASVISQEGTLSAIDKLITMLLNAYKGDEPRISQRYGTTTEMVVWQGDETLRRALREARNRAVVASSETEVTE
jgi:hypothetical protein